MRVLVCMAKPHNPMPSSGSIAACRATMRKPLPQRPRLRRVEVGLVLQHVEFAVGWMIARHDLLLLRQFRLTPYPSIGGIGVDEWTARCLALSRGDEMRQ